MRAPLDFLFPTSRGIPWLALATALVLQQGLEFIWDGWLFGDSLVRDQWAPQELGPDGQATPDRAVSAPREMKYIDAVGFILLAMAPQRLNWPVTLGGLQRGLLWGFLFWLCVVLPVEAVSDPSPMDDPVLFLIDAGQSLLSWLLAGAVIGAWPRRREIDALRTNGVTNSGETR